MRGVMISVNVLVFFFKQKTAYEMRISDWSSDACSSDLSRVLRAAVSGLAALCIAGAASAQERVEVASPEALLEFFENLDYTPEAWQAGIREVPRVYLMDVGEHWKVNSQNIEVIQKKRIFYRNIGQIGRAHVGTPVTNSHIVFRLLLEKN